MAYYEYECRACMEHFTVKQTFDEHDRHEVPECPKCGSGDVEQTISEVHVQTAKKS